MTQTGQRTKHPALPRRRGALAWRVLRARPRGRRAAAGQAGAAPGDVVWRDFSQRSPGGVDSVRGARRHRPPARSASPARPPSPGAPSRRARARVRPGGAVALAPRVDLARTQRRRRRRAGARPARRRRRRRLQRLLLAAPQVRRRRLPAVGPPRHGRRSRACSFAAVAVDGSGNVYAAGAATPAGGDARLLLAQVLRRRRPPLAADAAARTPETPQAGADRARRRRRLRRGALATGAGTSAALVGQVLARTGRGAGYTTTPRRAPRRSAPPPSAYAAGPVIVPAGAPRAAAAARASSRATTPAGHGRGWPATTAAGVTGGPLRRRRAADAAGRVCVAGDRAGPAGGSRCSRVPLRRRSARSLWERVRIGAARGFGRVPRRPAASPAPAARVADAPA